MVIDELNEIFSDKEIQQVLDIACGESGSHLQLEAILENLLLLEIKNAHLLLPQLFKIIRALGKDEFEDERKYYMIELTTQVCLKIVEENKGKKD